MVEMIYLNESKRIRKEYLECLTYIVSKEKEIEKHISEIEKIKSDMENTDPKNHNLLIKKLKEIEVNINSINKFIKVYDDIIKELDSDQRLLWNNIKEKYPNDDEEDIKRQIMEFVEPFNIEFREKNEVYKELINKQR